MAGATREITDPVEAAKHGIGSSKRLIAATLDDLSAHHSWLETYHRDERLRAERLRRRRRSRRSIHEFAATLRKAQARVERQHFRQRRVLLYYEKERRKIQLQMGQDPYLDAAQ